MSNGVNYEALVKLPSKGLLYEGELEEIGLRGMTTKEEKILYASQSGDVFQKILNSCVVSPENFDASELIAADEIFLILQLRMVTYGPEYKVSVTCPHCGKEETYTINLGDFKIDYLPDDFVEPIEIVLPKSGKKLGVKLLRNSDVENVNKFSRKHSKQYGLDYKEVRYTANMAKYIRTIDGKDVTFAEAREFVDNMSSLDSAKFWTVINKIVVGVDSTVYETCPHCGEEFEFSMPMTSEFFRPVIE